MYSAHPRASVIVVNYNGGRHVVECLQALQRFTPGFVEIIVVDNASTDGSVDDLANQFPRVKLLRSPANVGYARGINLSLSEVRGEYVVVLNMDVLVTQNWLPPLLDYLEANPHVAAVTPCILLHETPDRINALGQNINVSGLGFNRRLSWPIEAIDNTPIQVSGLQGGAFAIRTTLFRELGGMNEMYFLYHEDVELSLRIALAGYQIHSVPAAVVLHKYVLHMTPEKLHWLERHRWVTLLSTYHPSTYLLLAPFLLITELMILTYCLMRGLPYLRAKMRAIQWVFRNSYDIAAVRRRTQNLRRVRDRHILATLRWWYDWDQFAVLAQQRGGWLNETLSSLFTRRAHDRAA